MQFVKYYRVLLQCTLPDAASTERHLILAHYPLPSLCSLSLTSISSKTVLKKRDLLLLKMASKQNKNQDLPKFRSMFRTVLPKI